MFGMPHLGGVFCWKDTSSRIKHLCLTDQELTAVRKEDHLRKELRKERKNEDPETTLTSSLWSIP